MSFLTLVERLARLELDRLGYLERRVDVTNYGARLISADLRVYIVVGCAESREGIDMQIGVGLEFLAVERFVRHYFEDVGVSFGTLHQRLRRWKRDLKPSFFLISSHNSLEARVADVLAVAHKTAVDIADAYGSLGDLLGAYQSGLGSAFGRLVRTPIVLYLLGEDDAAHDRLVEVCSLSDGDARAIGLSHRYLDGFRSMMSDFDGDIDPIQQ